MVVQKNDAARVVVGGGIFGCYAAIVLADRGHTVLLIEQDSQLLARASFVNQARLHTGLHYPRSLLTATEALERYVSFRATWPDAVRDFTQIYAVAAHNSRTSGADFASFITRLGLSADEIDPNRWFHPGTVSRAFKVEEPSFDAVVLRQILTEEIASRPNISVLLNSAVVGGEVGPDQVTIALATGDVIEAEGVVLAVYAGTNALRRSLGLPGLPLTFELAEVLLGRVTPELRNFGFTVMDGPFWSMMPFGHGDQVSLTSVGLTPLSKSADEATFACQSSRFDCQPLRLQPCTACLVRPVSAVSHQQQQMSMFLKQASAFTATDSMLTVKAILTATEVDDARPTLVQSEPEVNVTTVFSGKISTVFDLESELP